jgi:hypothetical protein
MRPGITLQDGVKTPKGERSPGRDDFFLSAPAGAERNFLC